eukprot:9027522-Pyramimonas_sp.AAC.1
MPGLRACRQDRCTLRSPSRSRAVVTVSPLVGPPEGLGTQQCLPRRCRPSAGRNLHIHFGIRFVTVHGGTIHLPAHTSQSGCCP